MSESDITTITASALAFIFLAIAVVCAYLSWEMSQRHKPTFLGRTMKWKYAAQSAFFVVMCSLNAYTAYFSATKSVGIFTFPVRTGLRWSGVVLGAIMVTAMIMMAIEYYRTRKREG